MSLIDYGFNNVGISSFTFCVVCFLFVMYSSLGLLSERLDLQHVRPLVGLTSLDSVSSSPNIQIQIIDYDSRSCKFHAYCSNMRFLKFLPYPIFYIAYLQCVIELHSSCCLNSTLLKESVQFKLAFNDRHFSCTANMSFFSCFWFMFLV